MPDQSEMKFGNPTYPAFGGAPRAIWAAPVVTRAAPREWVIHGTGAPARNIGRQPIGAMTDFPPRIIHNRRANAIRSTSPPRESSEARRGWAR